MWPERRPGEGKMAAGTEEREGLGRRIESRSIDYVPEDERHGKVWHQGPFWFLGNFQFFTITIGFIGPGPERGGKDDG
jgi:NCS1 family nucleobase:cation symporter-1